MIALIPDTGLFQDSDEEQEEEGARRGDQKQNWREEKDKSKGRRNQGEVH